jgi:hypothetical protein
MRRYFKFKELYDPQQTFKRNSDLPNPSLRKVMKGTTTSFATIFFPFQPVYFSASTGSAKNAAIFPTVFFEKKARPIFSSANKLKCFKVTMVHKHKINLVQIPL